MKKAFLILSVFILVWAIWANTGFHPELPTLAPEISLTENISPLSSDSIRGNVVGIQPYMLETDYLTPQQFHAKLESYFQTAKESGFFKENTIVLLPEYLGTWLVIQDEKKSVANAGNLTLAMAQLILSHPFDFIRFFSKSAKESDKIAASLFRMKSEKMAKTYAEVFSRLSSQYQVYISAGSILLPGPEVKDGNLTVEPGQGIYNTSFLFDPNGNIHPQSIRKAFTIDSEKPFVTQSPSQQIPKFDLPFGKVGVLVCADSWYPESYQAIEGVDLVLVNSYCAVDGAMYVPWAGYNGAPMPSDVDPNDVRKLTEKEAWMKYALPGRIGSSGAKTGANVFLRGQLWDLGTDGQPFFIRNGKLLEAKMADKGGIWNMDF